MGNPAELELLEVSCSQLDRAAICPPSLLRIGTLLDTAGPEARLGTAVHHLTAAAVEGRPLEVADVARMFSVDPDELEHLGSRAWRCWEQVREYFPAPQTEEYHLWQDDAARAQLTGHVDVLAFQGIEPRILDWKTGFGSPDPWQQLRGYALLALDLVAGDPTPVDRVYAVVIHVREGQAEGRWFTRGELLEWWQELVGRLRKTDRYSAGKHCTYCPRSYDCPAKTAMLRQAVEALYHPDLVERMTENTAAHELLRGGLLGTLLERVRLVETACERARDAIRADVAAHGGALSMPDGRELALVEQKRTKIDYHLGWGALQVALPHSELAQCVTVSKTKVEELVRKRAAYRQGAAEVRRLMVQLREDEALSTEVVQRLEIRRREPETGEITHATNNRE